MFCTSLCEVSKGVDYYLPRSGNNLRRLVGVMDYRCYADLFGQGLLVALESTANPWGSVMSLEPLGPFKWFCLWSVFNFSL